jgi:hypothetical protein
MEMGLSSNKVHDHQEWRAMKSFPPPVGGAEVTAMIEGIPKVDGFVGCLGGYNRDDNHEDEFGATHKNLARKSLLFDPP